MGSYQKPTRVAQGDSMAIYGLLMKKKSVDAHSLPQLIAKKSKTCRPLSMLMPEVLEYILSKGREFCHVCSILARAAVRRKKAAGANSSKLEQTNSSTATSPFVLLSQPTRTLALLWLLHYCGTYNIQFFSLQSPALDRLP